MTAMEEIWKSVPSFPRVEASSLGRVRTVKIAHPANGREYGGTTMTYGAFDGKRFTFQFRDPRYGIKRLKVARLVCEAFHGPAPDPKSVCMHLDENARNNRPENLAWGSQKENLNAPGFIAYCRGRIGEKSPTTKARARCDGKKPL